MSSLKVLSIQNKLSDYTTSFVSLLLFDRRKDGDEEKIDSKLRNPIGIALEISRANSLSIRN